MLPIKRLQLVAALVLLALGSSYLQVSKPGSYSDDGFAAEKKSNRTHLLPSPNVSLPPPVNRVSNHSLLVPNPSLPLPLVELQSNHSHLLPTPDLSLPPVSFTSCCGLGHRLSWNIPTIIYAVSSHRPVVANWKDSLNLSKRVRWSAFFRNTDLIVEGPRAEEHHLKFPSNWAANVITPLKEVATTGTSEDRYGPYMRQLFHLPLGWAVVESMRDSVSPLVLSYLNPLREQRSKGGMVLCAHVREGNGESDRDWQRKKWRHVELHSVLNATLAAMETFAEEKGTSDGTNVFVASDNPSVRPWFMSNLQSTWRVIQPGKEMPRPKSGVWFGEWGSKTTKALNQTQMEEAMAEAISDMFVLGECDALFIPTYSSFTIVSIMLTMARGKEVFFMETGGTKFRRHEGR